MGRLRTLILMTPRFWLFVPGNSPEKIQKANGAGADALILDMEDSVALARKPAARAIVAGVLRARPSGMRYRLRINPLRSGFADDDLAMLKDAMPEGIVLPKCESGTGVLALGKMLERLETLPAGGVR